MKLFVVLLLVGVLVLACESEHRAEILGHGQIALNESSKALQEVWNSAIDQAKKIDTKSTREQIDSARHGLIESEAKLQQGTKGEADAFREQIRRLDAAKRLKDLQDDLAAKVEAAKQAKKNFDEGLTKTQDGMNEANQALTAAQEKADEAKKIYDSVAEKAKSAWNAVSSKF